MYTARIAAALVLLTALACTPTEVKMNPKAALVRVASDTDVQGCAFMSMVTARHGGNFMSYETNVDNATNDLRNKAAQKGATHLVMNPPEKDNQTIMGNNDCNNCVMMTGKAYKCTARSSKKK